MNDTTTKVSETCHSVIKTHIEPEYEEKTNKVKDLYRDSTHRSDPGHVSLRPDGCKSENMQFDLDEFRKLNDEYGPITLDT